jgi:hypothetical protein
MRSRCALCAITLFAVIGVAPYASADTATIGSASPTNFPMNSGCSGCHTLQFATDPSSPSYVVPAAPPGGPWTITSWSARGGFAEGTASVEVWRATATANEFSLVAIGPEQSFPANAVMSHDVNIPVQPGDHLGVLSLVGEFSTTYDSPPPADVTFGAIGNPGIGGTIGAPTSGFGHITEDQFRINAAATLTAPSVPAQKKKKKKCKKKKKNQHQAAATKTAAGSIAESAKKKKCKKRKKH